MLLPSRTDVCWFHETIWDRFANRPRNGIEIRFLKSRLRFNLDGKPLNDVAAFPSMIVVFKPRMRPSLENLECASKEALLDEYFK